ncbi:MULTISPECIES: CoA pyrophosphatase [unclassified Achromobacter]|uniref:CoA pyrophosphatase n=1 Tax=unclassified Achromobacter TaxID=2626865 RepID=UPI000B51D5BE|nr:MULTISPECIES: CoA pyrophosphatase [unclassified Achromobacter]OWT70242.1 CoA pyrophosphatase [Achromobacter sp. HZ34]OWT71782.1 CoA pyrophosphatase [Achromobacter sp. HZ28]
MSDRPSPARPRRPAAGPAFDPASTPWVVANDGLPALPLARLSEQALRDHLTGEGSWSVQLPLNDDTRYPGREGTPVMAAVLVPLVTRPDGVYVLLTQRAAHLHDHAGQISFPGGRIEDSDASPVAAALREAQEETGLTPDYVEVLGTMPRYMTATGFSVIPVVGLVRPGFTLAPDAFEVAEVFEVPLSFIVDPANHRLHRAELPDGRVRQYYSMPWGNFFIWGATAAMLRNLYYLLGGGRDER